MKDICSIRYLDGISVRCFFKYLDQRNFNLYKFQHCEGLQLCWRQLVAEGWQVTRLSLLDMDGEILRRDFHCFDRDGEILMAVERKTFRPANVSWWSFPFCFCCLLMKLTLFWHSISCRMWVSTGFGSGRAYIKTPTHAFAVYWWSWDLPYHTPFLWICHSNRS